MPRAYNSNAKKCELDGIKFDSRAEMRYWRTLRLLERSGQISELYVHPTFTLQPGFMLYGKLQRAMAYEADFSYMENGVLVIADVKAMKWTPKRTKRIPVRSEFSRTRRLFEYQFREKLNSGEWRLEIVDAKDV